MLGMDVILVEEAWKGELCLGRSGLRDRGRIQRKANEGGCRKKTGILN